MCQAACEKTANIQLKILENRERGVFDGNQLIWVLQTARAGDNAQVLEIANRLGGNIVVKKLTFNAMHVLPNWMLGASLSSLAPEARRQIVLPWPNLVVAAGKRTVPVARWIKAASGGRAKLVQVGRPRAAISHFDLVISTPQYGLPKGPNVVELALPFASPRSVSEQEVSYWVGEWKGLPRPWTMVSIGAGKFPLRFDARAIGDLGEKLALLNSSLIAIASPRTGPDVLDVLAQHLKDRPAKFYPWRRDPAPYQAALVLADRIVVTSDSISMVSEAINSGKPVSIFRLPARRFFPSWSAERGFAAWLSRQGLLHAPRNTSAVIDGLIAKGYASPLGEEAPVALSVLEPDYQLAIDRVRNLHSLEA
jgi:mitochondrial fission protein ELM1